MRWMMSANPNAARVLGMTIAMWGCMGRWGDEEMTGRDRYANLQCYEDFEREYKDYVTTDALSTP